MKGVFVMENSKTVKQLIDYQKAAFETSFNSVLMLQEQTSKVLDNMLQQSPWLPAQAKAFVSEWTNIYKKVTTDFKEAADQNYSKMEEFLISDIETSKSKTKGK
jgi:polyhydroxyalkanoate synthesis regulator phasin